MSEWTAFSSAFISRFNASRTWRSSVRAVTSGASLSGTAKMRSFSTTRMAAHRCVHEGRFNQLALPGLEFEAAQFRTENHVGQLGLGVTGRRLLAVRCGPLHRLVVQHGVGRHRVHQAPTHDQDAGLVQLADVLRALVAVARVLRLGHQNGVFTHRLDPLLCSK